jgi:hypothetical protein
MIADGHASGETGMGGERETLGGCLCGAVRWRFRGDIPDATICNCTACRRYGALWAYGHLGEEITVEDPQDRLTAYMRGAASPLTFDFCCVCGNLVSWRGRKTDEAGRRRIAVNLRLADPDAVAGVALQRFDGLHAFDDLPRDGRTVGDVWF